jgi:hypothetical protein
MKQMQVQFQQIFLYVALNYFILNRRYYNEIIFLNPSERCLGIHILSC